MMHFQAMAATFSYWQPGEQVERERTVRQAALAAQARRSDRAAADRSTMRRGFIPRVAGALGLF